MTYDRYEAVYSDGRKVFLWHVDGVFTGYEVDLNGERWEVEDAAGLWWDLVIWQGLLADYYCFSCHRVWAQWLQCTG